MAVQPGEMPDFDFGPRNSYPAERVAEQVMWPLVDALWRHNWRTDSEEGDFFNFPGHGKYQGRLLHVMLHADCDERENGTALISSIHSVAFHIESEVPYDARSIVLNAAKRAAIEQDLQEGDIASAEEGPFTWPSGDENDFEVRNGTSFNFDTEDDWGVERYRVVIGSDQTVNLALGEDEDQGDYTTSLSLHDLEVLESGLVVLGAPLAIKHALNALKARPVTSI